MGLQQQIAKRLMNMFPASPDPGDLSLWEAFRHRTYTPASEEEQQAIRLRSAAFRYGYEQEHCILMHYFPNIATGELAGKKVLDLGCFTGGRIVSWKERFAFGETHGIDINPLFETAGREFAKQKGVSVAFSTGFAEELPYEDNSFDLVVSFDVFEHVKDVRRTLGECHRVLRPGGLLLTEFPQFYQPFESHLGNTTRLHGLHWLFAPGALRAAICEIHRERGEGADWYATRPEDLDAWEVLPSLNGITFREFSCILAQEPNWRVVSRNRAPILSSGRRSQRWPFPWLRLVFSLPARIPVLEELFSDRICITLQKGP